jgi:hypothetical protein
MSRPNPNESRTVIGLAVLATIVSTIAVIGTILLLQPLREIVQALGTTSAITHLIFTLQPLLWLGPLISPMTGWLYAQQKLSSRLAITILLSISVFAIGFVIVGVISLYSVMFKTFDAIG